MEPSHEIVLCCFSDNQDTAALKFDLFVDEYAAKHQIEYFFVESIRRLPIAFGEFIIHLNQKQYDKEYYCMPHYFDHRNMFFYNIDDDDVLYPLLEVDVSLFFIRTVVFE